MTALPEIARALGGEVVGGQVLAPGPGHDPRDRSLAVRLSADSPDGGFVTYSFAGDDWRACRDHVRGRLGLRRDPPADRPRSRTRPITGRQPLTDAQRRHLAVACWDEAIDPRGTIVEQYLRSRGLELPREVAGEALRFHPSCPWRDGERTIRVLAMVAAQRSLRDGAVIGVHRTRLTPDGRKVDRRMLGSADGAAIMLDSDVGYGLFIGEGIETCLAGRQLGLRPAWALAAVGPIERFPVLGGVDALTIFRELDGASDRAVAACAARWHAAGRGVAIVTPRVGKDLNDAIRSVAT